MEITEGHWKGTKSCTIWVHSCDHDDLNRRYLEPWADVPSQAWNLENLVSLISYLLAVEIHGRSKIFGIPTILDGSYSWQVFSGWILYNLILEHHGKWWFGNLSAGFVTKMTWIFRGQMWCMRRLLQIPWWILGKKSTKFVSLAHPRNQT